MFFCLFSKAAQARIREAVRLNKYVPYDQFGWNAYNSKDNRPAEELTLTPQGIWMLRGFSKDRERSLPLTEWLAASAAMEKLVREIHGNTRGDYLAQHNQNVTNLARRASWQAALEYDIQLREAWVADPSMDISVVDTERWQLIVTDLLCQSMNSPAKRSLHSYPDSSSRPAKRSRLFSSHCFRCGHVGHLPGSCTASTTITNRPAATIRSGARSKHALVGPNGRSYCFTFAKGEQCMYGASCVNYHGCSICGEQVHGAASCPAVAR